jgi:hypothetical protein
MKDRELNKDQVSSIDSSALKSEWKPVSQGVLIVILLAAVAFWIHALLDKDGFLLMDYINLPFHEFGHLLFGLFGGKIATWGGTIFQLAVPFGIFLNFYLRRDTTGVTFTAFWFGENLLNISVYIADARKMELPLVGGGEHDWNIILTGLHMLKYDTIIGNIVKASGWIIMVSAILWLLMKNVRIKVDV